MASDEISMVRLIADYPLFNLTLPLRCSCGQIQTWGNHVAQHEERDIVVSLRHPCACGATLPSLKMHLSRMQRRRLVSGPSIAEFE